MNRALKPLTVTLAVALLAACAPRGAVETAAPAPVAAPERQAFIAASGWAAAMKA